MSVIDSFSGAHRFLSNFAPAAVQLDGVMYPTVEHAFQAAKTFDFAARTNIQRCATAADAKRAGRRVVLRSDWEQVKIRIMEDLLRQKFASPGMRDLLNATRGRDLVEGNTWGDRFWGVCGGIGENHLGRLLMHIRDVAP